MKTAALGDEPSEPVFTHRRIRRREARGPTDRSTF
jgi:hypothetical protein